MNANYEADLISASISLVSNKLDQEKREEIIQYVMRIALSQKKDKDQEIMDMLKLMHILNNKDAKLEDLHVARKLLGRAVDVIDFEQWYIYNNQINVMIEKKTNHGHLRLIIGGQS